MADSVRIDKWLWAVRLFKTRAEAAKACSAGKVTINGVPVKPARQIRIGDLVTAHTGERQRSVRARSLIGRRVGASLVPEHCEDLTPPEERENQTARNLRQTPLRPKGSGRPTKKERRSLESFFNQPPNP
jgi:ribosome-associated heat shock protein Hsp15